MLTRCSQLHIAHGTLHFATKLTAVERLMGCAGSFSTPVVRLCWPRHRHTVQQLTSLRHVNGRPVAEVYTGARVVAAAMSAPAAGLAAGTDAAPMPADRFASMAVAQAGGGGGSRRMSASTITTVNLASTLATTSLSSLATSSIYGGNDNGGGGGGGEGNSNDSSGSNDAAGFGIVGQGPIVAFNLRRVDGSWVGYRCVVTLGCSI